MRKMFLKLTLWGYGLQSPLNTKTIGFNMYTECPEQDFLANKDDGKAAYI